MLNTEEKMTNSISEYAIVSKKAVFGDNVSIGHNTIIEDDVIIDAGCTIEENVIIRKGVHIMENSRIGANCIIGEHTGEYYRTGSDLLLTIGKNALIRSGSILYCGSSIGDDFQTGHQVTIREKSEIGNHVSVGTLSDIQGSCWIGNYVRMHSNVHVGMGTKIHDYVWIFPYTVMTNDPTPPSEVIQGVTIDSFAIVATGAILLPGIHLASDCLIAAGAIVRKDVEMYQVIGGNPGKVIGDVRKIRNHETGEPVYPWRYTFSRNMPWEKLGYEKWKIEEDKKSGNY